MIVKFQTSAGAVYRLDHTAKKFFQDSPIRRSGDLWSTPTVLVGKRVAIWTAPDIKGAARVIHTGVVVRREVVF